MLYCPLTNINTLQPTKVFSLNSGKAALRSRLRRPWAGSGSSKHSCPTASRSHWRKGRKEPPPPGWIGSWTVEPQMGTAGDWSIWKYKIRKNEGKDEKSWIICTPWLLTRISKYFWKIGDTWPFRDSWQLDMPPLPQKKKNIIQMLTGKKSTSLVFDVSPWFATCHAASVLVHPSKQQHAAEKGPLCSWSTRSGRSRRHRAPVPLAVAHGTHLIFPVPRHVQKKSVA